jgi:hypothetical protein
MKLPELSPSASPECVDPASAKAWLDNLPLANVATAQRQLLALMEEFNRFPTSAANRLEVMEALREAVNFVQIEIAKRFMNRALPMAEAEVAVFIDTTDLWEEMRCGYARCVEAAGSGEAAMKAQAALACQRALSYSGLKMFHHHRAYRQVPAADWRALHEVYRIAEQLGVEQEPVKDFLNRDVHDTSALIAYARAVLMGIANPNELSQRQLTVVAFLLELWSAKLDIAREPVQEEPGVPPLVVDLAGEQSPRRLEEMPKQGELRYLDTRKLAKSLRNRVGLLRKGESPAKLALGEDCIQPSCEQLLVFLFRQWCQNKSGREGDRRSTGAAAVASGDITAIHYYLSGRAFRQPGEQKELTKKQREEIATFGRVSTREEDDYSEAQGYVLEQWTVADESAQGMRITRKAGDAGRRYSHNQLLAVRPGDAKSFFLAQVRWLMSAENGDLHAGVKLLPGLPAPTAVRATGLNVQQEKYVPALSLTAVPALESPPALVLPVGWFKPNRVVEVFVDSPVRVKLTSVIDRGADFERVAYESVA